MPFPRLTWQESMDRYGCDKPDLRFGMEIADVTDIAAECGFSVFRAVAERGGMVRALNCKGCGEKFTRSTIETLTDHALGYGAKGMAWILIHDNGEINSILQKYFTPAPMAGAAGAPGGGERGLHPLLRGQFRHRVPHPVRAAAGGGGYAGPAPQG